MHILPREKGRPGKRGNGVKLGVKRGGYRRWGLCERRIGGICRFEGRGKSIRNKLEGEVIGRRRFQMHI